MTRLSWLNKQKFDFLMRTDAGAPFGCEQTFIWIRSVLIPIQRRRLRIRLHANEIGPTCSERFADCAPRIKCIIEPFQNLHIAPLLIQLRNDVLLAMYVGEPSALAF